MFLGWYDADKKLSATDKVAEATARYREKFHTDPEVVLCNPAEVEGLVTTLIVKTVNYIPRFTYYVGVEEAPA